MKFDALVEILFADGEEIKVKMSELLRLAYDPIGQVGSFDRPWRCYVSKRLVAESKSWVSEPPPDAEVEAVKELHVRKVVFTERIVRAEPQREEEWK